MQALTVLDVLSDSRTSADSVDGSGVRSGISMRRIDFWESSCEHHGMALKCAMGLASGWLCADCGLGDIFGGEIVVVSFGEVFRLLFEIF